MSEMNCVREKVRNGDRSFVDVVNGGNKNVATTNIGTDTDSRRTIEITQSDTNREILVRSVVGEVKARCFISKLSVLCKEQGLEKAEVKLLGGLEFMVVFDSERTASNVLEDNDHGFRRWVHKLRKGAEYDGTTCRVTWINILSVPISSWDENTFKEIAAVYGKILGLHNCRLEGNQNTLYGRVQIHTSSKGLIREELYVKVKEKYHKVSIVEEIRDITITGIMDVCCGRMEERTEEDVKKRKDNDMLIDEEEDDEDSNRDEGDSSGEDEEGEWNGLNIGLNGEVNNESGPIDKGKFEELMALKKGFLWGKNYTTIGTMIITRLEEENVRCLRLAQWEVGAKRLKKQMKDNEDKLFEGNEVDMNFNTRIVNDENKETKKKNGVESDGVFCFGQYNEDADRFLLDEEFNELWGNLSEDVRSTRPDCIFRDRLKNVKKSLRDWSKDRFRGHKESIENLKKEAMRWELEAEKIILSDSERHIWLEIRKQWEDKDREYENMLRQKARIRWDVEGDENSKFFHSFVKRRNKKCNLRGLLVNGVWCEDPMVIKAKMDKHYRELFFDAEKDQPIFCNPKVMRILMEEARMLEMVFSKNEVWEAIRGCSGDKAPGPDGFNLKFIRKAWEAKSQLQQEQDLWNWGQRGGDVGDGKLVGCGIGEFSFTYLGLSIGENIRSIKAWGPVVEKFKKRPADLKAKTMSFGDRLRLVKSVLGSLPLYYFSMFHVPLSVIKNLERIRKIFFWGGVGEGKKISWVKWDSILASFREEVLVLGL
uniref:Transposon TX1 n=1 Tax=Tanacetum cinerariifolium TaxID=118510 RepID=A0A6L2NQF5_TANCI|nr:transposon TX1 [Tanacetum cinerariifolium]